MSNTVEKTYMENFTVKYVEDIAIIKVDLITATLRDSQALWDTMDLESIFEKKKILIDLSGCNFVDSTFIGMIVKIFRYYLFVGCRIVQIEIGS